MTNEQFLAKLRRRAAESSNPAITHDDWRRIDELCGGMKYCATFWDRGTCCYYWVVPSAALYAAVRLAEHNLAEAVRKKLTA